MIDDKIHCRKTLELTGTLHTLRRVEKQMNSYIKVIDLLMQVVSKMV